jgi:hypothetical protein
MRGFEAAAGLVREPIRSVSKSRGFRETDLLTHWQEIAGPDLAPLCRPVKVSYSAKGGFGATLTVLASGAAAPLVQMQLERLLDRVNAVYGTDAISRIRITQTAATGFAEAQKPFETPNIAPPSPEAMARARSVVSSLTDGIGDEGLKSALDRLATNVLMRQTRNGPRGPGTQ